MNTEKTVIIRPDELPLQCPPKDAALWNQHPRVFLPIAANGDYRCPYCGQNYHLEGEPQHHQAY